MRKILMIITVGVQIASTETYAQTNEENEMAKEEAKIIEVGNVIVCKAGLDKNNF